MTLTHSVMLGKKARVKASLEDGKNFAIPFSVHLLIKRDKMF